MNVKRELTVILYKVVYFKTRLNASSKRRNEQMRHLNQKKKKEWNGQESAETERMETLKKQERWGVL